MRRFPALALSLTLTIAACATAPVAAETAPPSPIESCMASAGDDDARRACIGSFAQTCIDRDEGGQTTVGTVECVRAEQLQWEELRGVHVAALRDRETPSQLALLDTALDEHRRWAQARCAYAASIYEGGSLARVIAATCMRDAVAEHAIELAERYDEP